MSMPTWTFWDYVDANDQNLIEAWLNRFQEKTRKQIKSKLVAIFAMANAEGRLTLPRYEKLQDPYRDLIAIRWERNKIQYRVFGCYGDEARGEVWLLAGGKEQNNQYRPPGILDTALERRANVLQRLSRVRPTCLLENTN